MVRNQVVGKQGAERSEVLAHVIVVTMSAVGIHASASSEVHSTDEVDEVLQEYPFSFGSA